MGLDDFSPDIDSGVDGGGNSAEAGAEAVEKARKKAAASSGGIKRTKKDEQKAKKHDFLLAGFLVKIIINKKYDSILDSIFTATNKGFPSSFVVGILSLVSLEISDKIRELSGKEKISFNYDSRSEVEFDDHHLDPAIKSRINSWIEDIIDVVSIEYSSIQTSELTKKIKVENKIVLELVKDIFKFFLDQVNIYVYDKKAYPIAEFILSEVEKEVEKLEIEKI